MAIGKKRARAQAEADAGEARMAQQQLGDWLDKIPAEVQKKADEYVDKMRKLNKAREEKNQAHEACLASMKEAGLKKIRVNELEKWLVVKEDEKLITEPLKQREDAAA